MGLGKTIMTISVLRDLFHLSRRPHKIYDVWVSNLQCLTSEFTSYFCLVNLLAIFPADALTKASTASSLTGWASARPSWPFRPTLIRRPDQINVEIKLFRRPDQIRFGTHTRLFESHLLGRPNQIPYAWAIFPPAALTKASTASSLMTWFSARPSWPFLIRDSPQSIEWNCFNLIDYTYNLIDYTCNHRFFWSYIFNLIVCWPWKPLHRCFTTTCMLVLCSIFSAKKVLNWLCSWSTGLPRSKETAPPPRTTIGP